MPPCDARPAAAGANEPPEIRLLQLPEDRPRAGAPGLPRARLGGAAAARGGGRARGPEAGGPGAGAALRVGAQQRLPVAVDENVPGGQPTSYIDEVDSQGIGQGPEPSPTAVGQNRKMRGTSRWNMMSMAISIFKVAAATSEVVCWGRC